MMNNIISELAGVINIAGWQSSWIISLIVTVLLANIVYIYCSFPAWRVRHIPCPPRVFGIGHLHLLQKYQAEVFVKLARQYGPIYRFHMGRQPLIMVADAELCRVLAIKNFKSVPNRSIPALVERYPVLKKGLFFSKDSRWTSMRNIMLPLFHSEQMCRYGPLMFRIVSLLGDKLNIMSESEDVNISEFFFRMSLDVIAEAAFGTKFGLLEGDCSASNPDSKLAELANEYLVGLRMDAGASVSTILGILFPVLQHPVRNVLCRIPGTADWRDATRTIKLQERLNKILEKRQMEKGVETRIDALSLLLNAREASEASRELLTPDYLTALTFELLLAGTETTTATLSFILYLVAGHPEVEKRLLKEIDSFGPSNRSPSIEEIEAYPYVEQVIKEAMRLYITTPVVAREISEDIQLGGYHLAKGSWVWMALNAICKDERHYEDPEEFKPDRFDAGGEESKKRHPYAFTPFGLGPRSCIGGKFAMQELKIAIIYLYQRFTFQRSPLMEEPLALHFGLTIRAKYGVRLRLHRRSLP